MLRSGVIFGAGFAALALIAAYIMQYGFGLEPCRLCYWQRYPYFAILAIGTLALFTKRWAAALVAIATLFWVDFGIAAYHSGIELGIFELPAGCAASSATSMQDMMSTLSAPPAQCDRPAFVFLGLSLTMWNALAAFGMALVTSIIFKRGRLAGR